MAQAVLQFYFDYISPNAYLAWTQVPRLIAVHDVKVEPVPVLFAGLLDACGQRGPAEIPSKMRWMVRNILRKANRLQVPLNPPFSHPFNPLTALRVSSLPELGDERTALITAIFEAAWTRSRDVSDPATLVEVVNEVGLAGESLVQRANAPKIKALLRENTATAVRAGLFGVPALRVGEELFWGLDDFPWFEAFLRGEDSLCREALESWSAVRLSASRRSPGK
ncbi:MAG: 2-hydroxychromene-2-carboxylate isomerase [Gammaproteobacteria bacterium]